MSEAQMLREIIDAQLEMVCRFVADGTILFANRAYAENMGIAPHSPVGRSLWDFVTGDDRAGVQAQIDQLSPDNVSITIENRIETPQGPRWTLWKNHALAFDEAGRWTVAQSAGIDITERKQLEERLQLLVGELNHRVKNTLMVVQSLAYQSFRGPGVPKEPLARFSERLAALGAAHTALSDANWGSAMLADVIRQGLVAAGGESDRLTLAGPGIRVAAGMTVPLVMVIHELATNAIKYGALMHDCGSVKIAWDRPANSDRIVLSWTERGGPPVSAPVKRGFGSRLIKDTVERQMSGEAQMDFQPEGLACTLSFPCPEEIA
jgi:PAS domain S-box-containing protein